MTSEEADSVHKHTIVYLNKNLEFENSTITKDVKGGQRKGEVLGIRRSSSDPKSKEFLVKFEGVGGQGVTVSSDEVELVHPLKAAKRD